MICHFFKLAFCQRSATWWWWVHSILVEDRAVVHSFRCTCRHKKEVWVKDWFNFISDNLSNVQNYLPILPPCGTKIKSYPLPSGSVYIKWLGFESSLGGGGTTFSVWKSITKLSTQVPDKTLLSVSVAGTIFTLLLVIQTRKVMGGQQKIQPLCLQCGFVQLVRLWPIAFINARYPRLMLWISSIWTLSKDPSEIPSDQIKGMMNKLDKKWNAIE